MIVLSDRFKASFKVALAMMITYGIAMSMGWEKPFWAGLSVAFCSLATAGESINRGVHRVLGTFLAGVATVAMVALFPQDRWPFLLAMSAFIALCTYRFSGGSRFAFIWFNAGFNVPILAMLGGNIGLNSFDIIILRVQETALGVVVYSLVAVLVWPRQGGAGFKNAVRSVCDAHRQLIGRYLGSISGMPDDGDTERLRTQLTGQLAGLGAQLEGAVYDSDEIRDLHRAWRRCLGELAALNKALEQWRLGFDELRGLDLPRLMPGLAALGAELETRFAAIEAMFAGQPPAQQPRGLELRLDRERLYALSHFQRAAVLLYHDQLLRIEGLTQALFASISDIHDYGHAKVPARTSDPPSPSAVIDPDRLAGTIRQTAALWLTLLMVIYVPAFPNPVGIVALTNAFAMVLSAAPQVPASVLLLPTVLAAAFAGSLYLFVMPHLSAFEGLGAMIFAATFLIGYVFHRPQAALAKSMGLCMLVIIIGAENQQSYNFLYFANWFIGGILFVLALIVAWRFPVSFRAEDRFLAMLNRFLRSAGFLLSPLRADAGGKPSRLSRWRIAFHHHQVATLPHRLRAWGKALPSTALGSTNRDQLQSLLASLQVLSDRMQVLLELRPAVQSGNALSALLADIQGWRIDVQAALEHLLVEPGTVDQSAFRSRLDATLTRIEAHIQQLLGSVDESELKREENKDLYRLLGAHRGLSAALVELARHAGRLDWARLREARF